MFKRLFDPSYKEFKKCEKLATQVMALEDEYAKLSDDELKAKTPEFKERIKTEIKDKEAEYERIFSVLKNLEEEILELYQQIGKTQKK